MSDPAGTEHTVLIVEDDPDIAEGLRDALNGEGYQAVTASNGKEGLDRLAEIETPCLILLDLMMPVMSGGEFLAVLRERDQSADIPVVIVSAWPKEAEQIRHQAQGFVKKPIALDALIDVTKKFCDVGGGRR